MGLKEQLNAGSTGLKRDTVVLTLSGSKPQYTGSFDVGSTFVLLEAQTTTPCRVRLYGNQYSRNEPTELIRPFVSYSVMGQDIALISDISLDNTNVFHLNPALFGANLDNPVSSSIYYTVDTGSATPFTGINSINFVRFIVEDPLISNLPGITTRQTFLISGSLASGSSITGSIPTPRTYLLLQVTPNTSPIRLRLYASQSYRDILTEYSRSFDTEPSSSSGILADLYLDVTSTASLSPIIVGRNANDLLGNTTAVPITYYTLTNGSVASDVSASLYTFSLED
jgi:hypothetical protein